MKVGPKPFWLKQVPPHPQCLRQVDSKTLKFFAGPVLNELRPIGGPFLFNFWLAPPMRVQARICRTTVFGLLICKRCLRNEILEGISPQVGENLAYKAIRSETNGWRVDNNMGGATAPKTIVRWWLRFERESGWAATPKNGNHTFVHQVGVQL